MPAGLCHQEQECFELPMEVPAAGTTPGTGLALSTICGVTKLSYFREMSWKLF